MIRRSLRFAILLVVSLTNLILSAVSYGQSSQTTLQVEPIAGSPVQLIDLIEYNLQQHRSRRQPDLKALIQLSALIYDFQMGRPWGNQLIPEANVRLKNFRDEFCKRQSKSKTCLLPISLANTVDFLKVLRTMADLEVVADVQKMLAPQFGVVQFPQSYIERIHWIEPEMPKDQIQFLISGQHTRKVSSPVKIWNMTSPLISYSEMEYVFLYDLLSYRNGFSNDGSSIYTVFDSKNNPVLNIDMIKAEAIGFARKWKSNVQKCLRNPKLVSEPNLTFAEEWTLFQIWKEHKSLLQRATDHLKKELSSIPSIEGAAALDRFQREATRGDFPEEAYQQVTYSIFYSFIVQQSQYFSLAQKQRLNLGFKRQTWESLLHLQNSKEARMLLFQMHQEGYFETKSILSQFTSKSVGYSYLYEMVRALTQSHLDSAVLDYAEIIEPEFLEKYAPEAFDFLKTHSKGPITQLDDLTSLEKQQFWKAYLYDSSGNVRSQSVYRLGLFLMMAGKDSFLKNLAQEVWSKNQFSTSVQ